MEMEKNKEDSLHKQEKQTLTQPTQLICLECRMTKHQLLELHPTPGLMTLSFLCLGCGAVRRLDIGGDLYFDNSLSIKPTSKEAPGYV